MPISDADAYHFSLRFRLPVHQCIHGEDASLMLGSIADSDRLELRLTDNAVLKDARHLALYGFGYVDKPAAETAYEQARKAITLAAWKVPAGLR